MDAASEAEVAEEMNLDECPDEFLDPLTFMLMEDPVDLPCKDTVATTTGCDDGLPDTWLFGQAGQRLTA